MVTLAGESLPDKTAASEPEMLHEAMAVILAAGKGTRMRSSLPKVLHEIHGRAMLSYVISSLEAAGIPRIVTVVGYQAERVIAVLPPEVLYAYQPEQLGTGHAVMCAAPFCPRHGSLLVVCGDTPLLKPDTLRRLVTERRNTNAAAVMLTFFPPDPAGYGRVKRAEDGRVTAVVEHRDASEDELKIREANSGVYCFDPARLFPALEKIKADNSQGEYYLPDVLKVFLSQGDAVSTVCCDDPDEVAGVNTLEQLERVAGILGKDRRNS
ncbi:MAG: hypothetical protein Kow00107_05020 [Planctomycetota bacterium]